MLKSKFKIIFFLLHNSHTATVSLRRKNTFYCSFILWVWDFRGTSKPWNLTEFNDCSVRIKNFGTFIFRRFGIFRLLRVSVSIRNFPLDWVEKRNLIKEKFRYLILAYKFGFSVLIWFFAYQSKVKKSLFNLWIVECPYYVHYDNKICIGGVESNSCLHFQYSSRVATRLPSRPKIRDYNPEITYFFHFLKS